jgi:uncharacterized alpha-E superfamily protein
MPLTETKFTDILGCETQEVSRHLVMTLQESDSQRLYCRQVPHALKLKEGPAVGQFHVLASDNPRSIINFLYSGLFRCIV